MAPPPAQVVVVGGGPGLCDRLRLAGAEITLVDTPDRYEAGLVAIARRTVLGAYDDPALLGQLAAIHERTPFAAVLSLTEQGLLPAARIAEALGVPGLPAEVVARTRDKLAMRAWLRDKGFSQVACRVVRDAAEIHAFAAAHGYPVIVKPRHGQGSENVSCVRTPEAVTEPPDGEFIAEPFLDGPEFSVEAFSRDGEHHVLAVTGKLTAEFIEIGHVVPAPLDPAASAAVTAYVRDFLQVMGIVEGPSHTEVRLTAAGPEVIETHTRVGGDQIPTLVRQVTGYDLLDLTAGGALEQVTPTAGGAAIRFLTPEPGTVAAIAGVHRASGLPGVLRLHLPLQPGDRIPPVRDSRTRAGYVLATGSTAAEATETCRRAIAEIKIDIR